MSTTPQTILLHCCCAPCSLMPLASLKQQGYSSVLYYSNSNIHPYEEYQLRLETLKSYTLAQEIELIVAPYEPQSWHERVGVLGGPYPLIPQNSNYQEMLAAKERRCKACYALRFEQLAHVANQKGITFVSSTLSVSPYQFTSLIEAALEEAVRDSSCTAYSKDWRPLYNEATALSRELGMYRQNYCGCCYSQEEAQLEREARKAQRKKAHQERGTAHK